MRNKYLLGIGSSIFGISILILIVFGVSYAVWNQSIPGEKINELTTGTLNFNYTQNSDHIMEVDFPQILTDEEGKKMEDNGAFDFNVSVSADFSMKDIIYYDVVAVPVLSGVKQEFVKFYLTDKDNIALDGYQNEVPVFQDFASSDHLNEKVIYHGVLEKNHPSQNIRLRMWVDSNISDQNVSAFSYQLQVRLK